MLIANRASPLSLPTGLRAPPTTVKMVRTSNLSPQTSLLFGIGLEVSTLYLVRNERSSTILLARSP
jgi:hypothetical protein